MYNKFTETGKPKVCGCLLVLLLCLAVDVDVAFASVVLLFDES